MAKIKLLEQNLINQIAAGEVIERPVSVIKELVENSLDAGATNIVIEIIDGGKQLIKVTDNGEGISREDLPLALQRHATSKIHTPEDLFKICTLGFRGEALASMASVSRMSVASKSKDSAELNGYKLILDASEIKGIEPVAAVSGTTIEVRDLFYNLPARLKFLKSASTEAGHIQQWLSRLMLSRPDVSYTLISDGKNVIRTQGGRTDSDLALRNAIGTVYGTSVAKALRTVNLEYEDFSISGFVSEPTLLSSSRQGQVFFVNNRNINSPLLNKALDTAVSDLIPSGKYPYAVLFLDIAYDQVDVNVHPAKKEVRFAESSKVFEAVKSAVRNAYAKVIAPAAVADYPRGPLPNWSAPRLSFDPVSLKASTLVDYPVNSENIEAAGTAAYSSAVNHDIRILGQAYRLFIIVLDGDDLLLIDQHAAHERILYEKFKAAFQQTLHSQPLLQLEHVELGTNLKKVLTERHSLLESFGYRWTDISETSVVIREVPVLKTTAVLSRVFRELLEDLAEHDQALTLEQLREHLLATMACKAAVKDGDVLDWPEMKQLVLDLMATPNYQTCPHGRPTIITITKPDLAKSFKRK